MFRRNISMLRAAVMCGYPRVHSNLLGCHTITIWAISKRFYVKARKHYWHGPRKYGKKGHN